MSAGLCEGCVSGHHYRLGWPEPDAAQVVTLYWVDGSGQSHEGVARADADAMVPAGAYVPDMCLTTRCALTEVDWSGERPRAVASSLSSVGGASASIALAAASLDVETGRIRVCEVELDDAWRDGDATAGRSLIAALPHGGSSSTSTGPTRLELWSCLPGTEILACPDAVAGASYGRVVDADGCGCHHLRDVVREQVCFDVES